MRTSQHAHFGDALSYVVQRLFPRQHEAPSNAEVTVIHRFERGKQLKRW
jgi:hypothetical protein